VYTTSIEMSTPLQRKNVHGGVWGFRTSSVQDVIDKFAVTGARRLKLKL